MSELWGFASGQQQAQQQQNQNQLTQMQIAEGAVGIQEKQIHIAQEGVALQSASLTLKNQQKMQSLLQQAENGGLPIGPNTGALEAATSAANTTASALEQMSKFALDSGMVQQGAEYAEKASTIRKNAAEIQGRATTQNIKDLTLVANLMDGVHDQQSWNAANMLFMAETGHESKVAHLPYSPDLVQRIKSGAMTQKDQALKLQADSKVKANLAEVAERQARVPLIKAQTQLDKDRDDALTKAGAKSAIPKAGNIKALTDMALKDYGGAGDAQTEADMRVAARPYAEKVEQYMKNGLSQSEATAKAYRQAKEAGVFAGLKPLPQSKGATPQKPLDLPMKGTTLDKSKLQQNQWYSVNGKPMVLMGDKMYSLEDLGHNESLADDDKDDDDEE